METRGTNFRKVAIMNFAPDEADLMASLNTVWVQTMDLEHENILAYPIDIMVEHIEELYPVKYIQRDELVPYTAENGSKWLLSTSLNVLDVDAFFTAYLHLDEEEIAA